jgi:primosomal protein N' (replication factor Y)
MNICSQNSELCSYAEVAIDGSSSNRRATFTFSVPVIWRNEIGIGQLVFVPARRRVVLGVVAALHDQPPAGTVEIRAIHAPVEPTFHLSDIHWALAVWISERTLAPLFEAAALMFPPGVTTRAVEQLHLAQPISSIDFASLTPLQARLARLLDERGPVSISAARKALDSSLVSIIPALEARGLIERQARVQHRKPRKETKPHQVRLVPDAPPPPASATRQRELLEWLQNRIRLRPTQSLTLDEVLSHPGASKHLVDALVRRGSLVLEPVIGDHPSFPVASGGTFVQLTPEQAAVWSEIESVQRKPDGGRVLLHGVTGSGKTELYFRSIAMALAHGRSAILLVPEISLASQVLERAKQRFGDRVVLLHSAVDDRTRYENWMRAADGGSIVVVGARSALFAPLSNLGVVILDEEHESAYKQDQSPRYHARAVAERLAELHRALVVLGSATPDLETYQRAIRGEFKLLELRERVGQRTAGEDGHVRSQPIALPKSTIIDMRRDENRGISNILSPVLLDLIRERLKAGEQTLLYLNRRGLATIVQCRSCGAVSQCPWCDIPLVYHGDTGRLLCHRCGHRETVSTRCSVCGSPSIGFFGVGIQRVEREARERFPSARVLRWDRDVIKGDVTPAKLLEQAQGGRVDILVGTQMIAKGLDLPAVTLVGVINADTELYLPDFRSTERAFQLLAQVAGRAGRRTARGEVVIQTWSPSHYAITSGAEHDYRTFFENEIAFRRQFGYPPFKPMIKLLYRHTDEATARYEAERFADYLEAALIERRDLEGVDILGPAPAFAAKIRGRYGYQLVLRGAGARALLAELQIPYGWVVDVDPVSLL